MVNFLEEKGILSVELGEGWLSRDEVLHLKGGDVVKVNKFAGDPLELRFNGQFLASCDLVIMDGILGARISGFSESPVRHRIPGNQISLTEILQLSVRIGEARFTLAELESAAVGTIISLGIPYSNEVDSELIVAGQIAAKCKIVVLYEDFGVRIISTVNEAVEAPMLRSTGQLIDAGFKLSNCKDYDFRRPDKLTRIAIDKIAVVHQNIIHTMNSRVEENLTLNFVDQIAFYETFQELQKSDATYLIGADDFYSSQRGASSQSASPTSLIVEGADTDLRVSQEIWDFLKELSSVYPGSDRPFFVTALGELGQKLLEQPLLPVMNASWRNAADFNFLEMGRGDELSSIKKIHENEMIVIAHIGLDGDEHIGSGKIGGEGLYFIYPLITLEPALGLLNL